MARRRMLNTVRTDYIESQIAHFRARQDYGAVNALEILARDVGAPLDSEKIDAEYRERKVLYDHWAHGGKSLEDISKCEKCNPGVEL